MIIAAGTPPKTRMVVKESKAADLIIAADAGMSVLRRRKIIPNVVIGDLDSAKDSDLGFFIKEGVEVIRLKKEKDETDAVAALDLAIGRGATSIVILGAFGDRLDHTLANFMLLTRAYKKGVRAYLKGGGALVYICEGRSEITGKKGDTVSILPVGEYALVESSAGLHYPLQNLELKNDFPVGISNVLISDGASINVTRNQVFVIVTGTKRMP